MERTEDIRISGRKLGSLESTEDINNSGRKLGSLEKTEDIKTSGRKYRKFGNLDVWRGVRISFQVGSLEVLRG